MISLRQMIIDSLLSADCSLSPTFAKVTKPGIISVISEFLQACLQPPHVVHLVFPQHKREAGVGTIDGFTTHAIKSFICVTTLGRGQNYLNLR